MKSKGSFCVLLIFFMSFDYILGSATYKSLIWDPENLLFKNDCPSGKPKVVNVEAQSKINFVCPNVATLMDSTLGEVTKTNKYENLWLVHNSAAFNSCDVTQDPKHSILMRCEDPTSLQFRTVIFQRHSAENSLTFQKGKSYFFISTCNGKFSSVNNTKGGHCNGTETGGFLKIEMHVCQDGDTACLENVGKPHCRKEPSPSYSTILTPSATLKPSSTVGKKIVSTSSVVHTETSILPTTASCNTQGECTATETKTVAVSSPTQSPTEGGSAVPLLEQKGARDSESEDDESKKWKISTMVLVAVLIIAVIFSIGYHCFWKKKMKCPYQYDVKVEPSNGYGMKNDGFKSETDDNSLKRGVSPPDFNEKGSLEITNGGQDVHYHNGNADIKKGLPV